MRHNFGTMDKGRTPGGGSITLSLMKIRIMMVGFLIGVSFIPQLSFGASVATSSPLASQTAMKILKAGGSAVDAACAASFVINVTQSYFEGMGGGGFALVHPQKGGDRYFDFREEAPKGTTSDLFAASGIDKFTGGFSVGIPGHVAGCGKLTALYGKLSWSEILKPAIALAKDGYEISKNYEEEEADEWKRISNFLATKALFGGAKGTGLKKGEILKQPLLGATLERLSQGGSKSFYEGELAKEWWTEASAQGVRFELKELKSYKVIQRPVAQFKFDRFNFETAAYPSSAALVFGATLRYFDHYQKLHGKPAVHSTEKYIVTLEALDYFQEVRSHGIDYAKFLKSESSIQKSFQEIDLKVAGRMKKLDAIDTVPEKVSSPAPAKLNGHTAHISVVDDRGMAVAMTSSINHIYGSSITLPKSGFLLNDTMGDFDSEPNSPNAPKAGLRPRSSMSPTFVYDNKHQLLAVAGAAGGTLIPVALVQFFDHLLGYEMDPKSALAEARVEWNSKKVRVEKRMAPDAQAGLKKAGYELEFVDESWALIQAITRKDAKSPWVATSDARYDGLGITE